MPKWQLEKILIEAYGSSWLQDNFKSFELRPFAAASIGQVHRGVLHDGTKVVLKIQYPGVSNSIDSDLDNLKRLMNYTGIFPKSMFLDDFIKNTRIELKEECDYVLEKEKQMKYLELCKSVQGVQVPKIIEHLCKPNILAMEEIEGIDLDTCAKELSQDERNYIGTKVMEVTLREIFEWRFMQTDPNFANFFYNPNTEILYLLDLGAGKDYEKEFCKNYLDTVWGASNNDPALILKATTELGFLSGQENPEMIKAHIQSIISVGQPFSKPGLFDFGNQTMTREIYELMPVMLKNRLKPPPPEVYSLHRKLSGAYLMNIHLKSKIPSRELFQEVYRRAEPLYRV
jgi:aarF domain-containing kinase